MVNAATFAVAAAVATTAFAAPALEARRRGGRAGSRVSQSSRTDKIAAGIGAAQLATDVVGLALPKRDLEFVEVEARRRRAGGRSGPRSSTTDKITAGIGAAQLATDVAGLVIPKDVDSADFEARDFSDDELEARDLEELEARRFKVKTLQTVKTGTGETVIRKPGKRDLEFVEVEARRRRAGGRSGPRSSTTDKIAAGVGAAGLATSVAGLVMPKRDLEFVEVEARRRRAGGRSGPRSSTTDKITAGIGAAQLATDVAGLVIPKDVESADFEARDFSDDELEARDFEDLEARRFKVKSLNVVTDPKTGQGWVKKGKRDLEFVEVEARRRRAGGRSGPRSSTTDKITAGIGAAQLATDVAGLVIPKDIDSADFEARDFSDDELEARDFEELEARRRRAGGRSGPRSSTTAKIQAGIDGAQLATDVAGLVIPKRDLEFVEVEARRRRGGRGGALGRPGSRIGPATGGNAQLAVMKRDFEDLEARRRRAGGRSGPRSSTTDKIQAGVDAAGLATSVAGLVMPKRDLEFVEVEARRSRGAGARGIALRGGLDRPHVATIQPAVLQRDFEELEARRRRAGGRSGPRSSTTAKIQAGIDGAQLATDVAGLVIPKRDLEFVEVEARRRRRVRSGAVGPSGGASIHVATLPPNSMRRDFEELEARRSRAGGARRGPRSSTTDKISAGIGAAQLATDVTGLVTAREFDLEMLD